MTRNANWREKRECGDATEGGGDTVLVKEREMENRSNTFESNSEESSSERRRDVLKSERGLGRHVGVRSQVERRGRRTKRMRTDRNKV